MSATTAVIGAGVIGCAIAWALARDGRRVLLIDRDEPATAGASFGNAGHIATEQVEPLPSVALLLRFWRELTAFGGPLELPLTRLPQLSPWMLGFVGAALRQRANTRHLAPLVRSAADALERMLTEIGHRGLLRRHGHYTVWLGAKAQARMSREHAHCEALEVRQAPMSTDLLGALGEAAGGTPACGLWFPDTAHVQDPRELARALAGAACAAGSRFLLAGVRALASRARGIEIITENQRLLVDDAVVCAGAWSAPLLAPFGVRAPLAAERGYHVELPGHEPQVDAPVVYADHSIVVTPMAGRLRATSYVELAGLTAPPDPAKGARLRRRLAGLGYAAATDGPAWMGPRPTLPDYLPGIGRARREPRVLYAVGHQHLGLTLAAPTAELIAALAGGRCLPPELRAFDLARFGSA